MLLSFRKRSKTVQFKKMVINKRAQLTIFIIVAIVIVGAILAFFWIRSTSNTSNIPAEFKPVEEYLQSCINTYTLAGISILEESGGYIYQPEFRPGSAYSPTSNKLDFMGSGIPYWYYVSGNNIINEQIPSKQDMEKQLERYLEDNFFCDFSEFTSKDFAINLEQIKPSVTISDNDVEVSVAANLEISKGEQSVKLSKHSQQISSKLGKFYNTATEIYNYEKQQAFLEKYGLDVMYTYAPVDNVELTCSPKIWVLDEIKNKIKSGLEANLIMLKTQGNYYSKSDSYFVSGIKTDEAVQFLYSKDWPTKIETQDDNGVLMASPIGNQPGLGILGFCYVPYHFVYDITFPVLIQIYDEKEIFRFPVVAVIQGNKERQALPGTYVGLEESEICTYKDAPITVSTYSTTLDPVEADISFKCFSQRCDIGRTQIKGNQATLTENFPRCVNGYVLAEAEGYVIKKQVLSSNSETNADIILDKLYDANVNFYLDNKQTDDMAVIYFESEKTSASLAWPQQKKIQLSEGNYNVTVYVYRNSSILIPESKTNKCVDIPTPGLLGIFGSTTKKCYDLTIPSQSLNNVIIGGGKSEIYITETELQKSQLDINVNSLNLPKTLEDLQKNYESVDSRDVYINFK